MAPKEVLWKRLDLQMKPCYCETISNELHPIASSAVYRCMTETVHVLHMFWILVSSHVQLLNVDYQRTTDFSVATVTVIGKSWRYVISVFHVTQMLLTNKSRSSSSQDLQARLVSTVNVLHSYRWHFVHPVGRPIIRLRPLKNMPIPLFE